MPYSLISYTYNDGNLLDRLLHSVPDWTMPPAEIIIVDDGSASPFSPPLTRLSSDTVRCIRHPENQGFARAKMAGLNAARHEVLVSVDCDVLLAPDWVEKVLPAARHPQVGLAAGSLVTGDGAGLVARFQQQFEDQSYNASGSTTFIPGCVFALRRDVWRRVQGFAGYEGVIGEDHLLCQRVTEAGLLLHVVADARARQARRLHRATYLRRLWLWCRHHIVAEARRREAPWPVIQVMVLEPMLDRIDAAIGRDELLFIYLELLYLFALCEDVRPGAAATAAQVFGPSPRVLGLFLQDLAAILGRPVSMEEPLWEELAAALAFVQSSGLGTWLETRGVPHLLAEDAQPMDFSAYAELASA